MITPEQYAAWPKPLVELIQRLEDYIISDICRRLKKEDWTRFTSTAYQQTNRLINFNSIDIKRITKEIAKITGMMQSEIETLLQKTYDNARKDVGYAYEKLGIASKLENSGEIQQLLRAQAKQTADEFKNITGSMGFAYRDGGTIKFRPVAYAYQDSLDFVQMQIVSGAVSPDVAVRNAVKRLTDSGVRTVDYASGHVNQVDVAVRRATVTGMAQVTGYIAEEQAQELGTDLVEVSAHGGARDTGSGFENHKSWQGKVYSLHGRSDKYPSLKAVTGYGNVAGLKGANCRHDFSPFVDGVMHRQWSNDDLKHIDKPPFVYDGKQYTAYEASQRQRQMETSMRATKRRLLGYQSAGLQEDFNIASSLLARQRDEYLKFSRAAGIRPQTERTQIYGFNRRASAKANASARKGKI